MESAVARGSSSAQVTFEDGLGQRLTSVSVDGAPLEVLALRDELTANASFELALRDRVNRLAEFESEHYARVRAVERIGKGSRLALISDRVQGVRLSEILSAAESRLLPVETDAALCLLRQLVHAISVLHDKAPELCHGAIGPERLIVTPAGRLMVVEYVLGSAIEQLRLSNKHYWQRLRVPLPRTLGMPHFDRRSDVTQIGATALALVIGRPLAEDEFPGRVGDMTGGALAVSADGGIEPLPLPLRVWLQRALQIDSRTPFGSALEAWADLDRVLHFSDPIAEVESLKSLLARYNADASSDDVTTFAEPVAAPAARPVDLVPPKPPAPVTVSALSAQASAPPTPKMAAVPPKPAAPAPVTVSALSAPASAPPAPKMTAVPPKPAAPAPVTALAAATSSATAAPSFWDRLPPPALDDSAEPDDSAVKKERKAVPVIASTRLRMVAAAVLLIALTAGATLATRRYLLPSVQADALGTLIVQTNPSGATVEVDGQQNGVTPLSLSLPPGRHTLKLTSEGNVRTMPVTITAGKEVSQFIELPRASSAFGELQVRTEPAGARVTVDGHAYGTAPVTVEGLSPGTHTVVLENELRSITQEVKIEANTTASLVVPLTAPANAPLSGWISVTAPAELRIFEDQRLIGTSQSDRIMMSVGRHTLQVVNEALGYRETTVVTVAPGKVSSVQPPWPNGLMSLNAAPWAQVWIDGQQVGETPLSNVRVPIGSREVVFRHPELGEKTVRAVVTAGTPTKLSVDLRQR
jgi:serine/threonine protein kinase